MHTLKYRNVIIVVHIKLIKNCNTQVNDNVRHFIINLQLIGFLSQHNVRGIILVSMLSWRALYE